jgi:recombination protein RecA
MPKNAVESALEKFQAQFDKSFGEGVMRRATQMPGYDVIPTGSPSLDYAMGSGGYIRGRLTELWGMPGSGKTTMSLIGMAEAQKAVPDRMVALVDVEKTYDQDWAVAHGIDTTRLMVITPTTAEDAADQMKSLIESNLFSAITLDSIGAMLPAKEAEKDAGDAVVGMGAKVVTRMVKTATNKATENHVAIILINQVRAAIGSFVGPDTTTPGGFALRHCTTHVLKHRRTRETPKFIGTKEYQVQVGHQIAINVEKNKVAPPKRTAYLWMFNQATPEYGPVGIDKVTDVFNLAKQLDLMHRSGAMYTLPDASKHNGEPAVIPYLRAHPEVCDMLRTKALSLAADTLADEPLQEG